MMTALIMLIAAAGLGLASVTFFRQRMLRDALRDVQRRLYLAQARLNELESTVQKELQGLRGMLRRQSGSPLFEPSMKIAEAIAQDPRVRDILAQFHLGGCSSCAINEEHTIEQAALSYGVDLNRLMLALEASSNGQEFEPPATRYGSLLQLSEF
jgi:hybrid cluster-associated redox disulfide protein